MIKALPAFNLKTWQILIFILPTFIYLSLITIDNYQPEMHLDFNAFYQSAHALFENKNPYRSLNLNPPIFFILFSPLYLVDANTAYIFYSITMAICLWIGTQWTYQIIAPDLNHKLIYTLLLICCYPTITNFKVGQLTPLLYLLLIGGYRSHLKHHSSAAAFLWGLLIALKFFPALLLGYLYQQRNYKLLSQTLLASIAFTLLPLLVFSTDLYQWYFSLVSQIYWYSHSWNFSVFGLPFKLFFKKDLSPEIAHMLKMVALILSGLGMMFYLKHIRKKTISQQRFFLFTIGMMLLLSPLAWQYYLILLFMPIIYLTRHFNAYSHHVQICILLAICCVIFPYNNEFIPRDNHGLIITFLYYCLPILGPIIITLTTLMPTQSSKEMCHINQMPNTIVFIMALIFMILIYTNLLFIKYVILSLT